MIGNSALEKLKRGVRRYQTEIHARHAAQYQRVAVRQKPHTLFVACADSRVEVEVITSAAPGEVFVARNIGNMVPAYGEMPGGVSAVIEFAVMALKVQHVVVCGHSDCGAMKALLHPQSADEMPMVRSWLTNGQAALSIVNNTAVRNESPADHLRRLTEENVLMQLAHLKTHPSVAGAIARDELTLSGWVYDIASGEVRIAANGVRPFLPIAPESKIKTKTRG